MSQRIRTAIDTEFRAGPLKARGKIRNVAEGGMFVGTASPPPPGERVSVSFTGKHGPVDVEGMVWWTTDEAPGRHRIPGFGLRLLDDCEAYTRFIESLS